MEYIAILVVVAILIWFVILRTGNIDFWKMAKQYPDEAYDFFLDEDCWYVNEKPDKSIVGPIDGPFIHYVPSLAQTIRLYCVSDRIMESQKRFIDKIRNRHRSGE